MIVFLIIWQMIPGDLDVLDIGHFSCDIVQIEFAAVNLNGSSEFSPPNSNISVYGGMYILIPYKILKLRVLLKGKHVL